MKKNIKFKTEFENLGIKDKLNEIDYQKIVIYAIGIAAAYYIGKTILDSLDEAEAVKELSKSSSNTVTKKVEKKKETKKVVKKYELKGERSIALSWDGYEDLIAGTVEFDEADYKGTLNLPLPNNDGTCDGTYSLQEGGKGTWQIACTNNMGAAGTLKWTKNGGVTGSGRDHNDKKVKFTVSKKS